MTVDLLEACRYLGVRGEPDDATLALVTSCAQEVQNAAQPRSTSREVPVRQAAGKLFLGPIETRSADLKKLLAGCERALLFAATLGAGVDRLILRATAASAARAVALDAAASALIESFCDGCQAELAARYQQEELRLTPRFSPGYGDLPLSLQGAVLDLLGAPKVIGLTLTDGGMLAPVKSVTAVMGLTQNPAAVSCGCRCALCKKTDCKFRKTTNKGV